MIGLLILQIILMIGNVYIVKSTYNIYKVLSMQNESLSKQIADVRAELLSELGEATLKPHLSSYELERLEREQSFDRRIAELKEELANQQSVIRSGISAEELHPLVKNLPHNIIAEKHSDIPDVEYAD